MKKILLATTAAICAGGVASAEVSLSGEGKLGLEYEKDRSPNEWEVISAAKVKFTFSGTSDNDMLGEYGASFELEADESVSGGDNPKLANPFVVYVGSAAGAFGKIEAGSDLGAGDKRSGGLSDPGLAGIGADDLAEIYYGGSGKKLRYDKEIGGAAVAISVDLEDAWAIGGEYAINDSITIGAGYDRHEEARDTAAEGVNDLNTLSFGVIGELGQISGAFLYSSRSTTVPTGQAAIADKAAYGLEVGYTLGATTFTAHYGRNDGTEPNPVQQDGWAVGVSHELGGGLSFKGAYANIDDVSKANFGFLMAFLIKATLKFKERADCPLFFYTEA